MPENRPFHSYTHKKKHTSMMRFPTTMAFKGELAVIFGDSKPYHPILITSPIERRKISDSNIKYHVQVL